MCYPPDSEPPVQGAGLLAARCDLRAPFPWFGGKSRVASLVWARFGQTPNYVEPFFGSGAVLLGRPHPPGIETVNDKDAYLANLWRALQHDPDAVAFYADSPVNEVDLHARHRWLLQQTAFRERLLTDPVYYDAQIAGWWVWGQSVWIGSGWCRPSGQGREGGPTAQLPHLLGAGQGVHRQLPHLGDAGQGVHRQLPHLGDAGMGDGLRWYFRGLAERLRGVRVCCGDWSRICGPTPTVHNGVTGVFLDPPYAGDRDPNLYATEDLAVAHAVRAWAIVHGNDPRLRIALCFYDEEGVTLPSDWEIVARRAPGGYGMQGRGRGRENRIRERIAFSPHCLKADLFAWAAATAGEEQD